MKVTRTYGCENRISCHDVCMLLVCIIIALQVNHSVIKRLLHRHSSLRQNQLSSFICSYLPANLDTPPALVEKSKTNMTIQRVNKHFKRTIRYAAKLDQSCLHPFKPPPVNPPVSTRAPSISSIQQPISYIHRSPPRPNSVHESKPCVASNKCVGCVRKAVRPETA